MDDVDLVRALDLASEGALILRRPDATRPGASIVHANRAFLELTGRAPDALAGRSARALRGLLGPRAVLNELLVAVGDGAAWAGLAELGHDKEPPRAVAGRGGPVAANAGLYLLWLAPVAAPAAARGPGERGPVLAGLTRECFYELEVDLDCRLRLVWADPRVVELTGYEVDEMLASGGIYGLVVEADRPEVARRNQRLLAGEEVTARYRIRRKDEAIRLVRDSARPEWSDDGSLVTRVIGALADPAADPADTALGPALERATGLLAAELDVFGFIMDLQGRVRWAAARPAGPVPDLVRGLVGQTLTPVQSPLAVDLWLDGLEAAAQRREPVSARQTWRLEAQAVEVALQLVGLTDDLVLVLLRDPGALGPASETAGARAVLGGLRAPMALLGVDLTVRATNAAFERLCGAAAGGVIGRAFLEGFVAPAGRVGVAELLERVLVRREPVRSFGLPCLIEGRERPTDLHLAPVLDGAGALIGVTVEAQPTASAAALPPGDAAPWFDAILDTIADGILTLDATGTVTWLSKAAAAIFDGHGEALLGAKITKLLTAGAGQSLAALDALLDPEADRAGPVEALARKGSGEIVPVEVEAAALEEGGRRRRVLVVRDITVRRQTEETLKSLAYHDPLTGLPNRLLFLDRLAQAIERARRNRQLLTVLQLDLDRFKLINDSLGLEKGDQVLRVVAERLSTALRRSDTVARLGGDEFMVLLLGPTGADAAAKVAQKLLDALRPPMQVDGHELTTAASIGIALFPHDGDAADTLLKNADTALTRAKEQGRNHYQFYATDMNASAFERLMLETRLRRALEQEELAVFYQPKVSLEDGRITGVEALLRWFHPELGLVPPSEFIPLAEETGLIVPIGEWVLRAACAQVHRWHLTGRDALRLAVNISARQFQQRNLTETVAAIVAGAGLPPSTLELELTESVIMRDAPETVRRLRELTTLGIRLSIDDFGTGYSSLSYLRTFPIAALKIDRSFVRDIDRDPNSATIARAIVGLGHSLSLTVVAEGVETPEQVALLREYGCHELQGYVFARPLPADELGQLLREGRRLEL